MIASHSPLSLTLLAAGVAALLVSKLTGRRARARARVGRSSCGLPPSPDSPHIHIHINGEFQVASLIYCGAHDCVSEHYIIATYKKRNEKKYTLCKIASSWVRTH